MRKQPEGSRGLTKLLLTGVPCDHKGVVTHRPKGSCEY